MAAKILANLIVMGSGIMIRAFAQAYRQALANASKNGVAQETVNTIRRASKAMTEQEARQILGISENSTWEEILKKYDVLFENNAKQGSFYLQSKVHRAKECLEAVYNPDKGQGTATGGTASRGIADQSTVARRTIIVDSTEKRSTRTYKSEKLNYNRSEI